MFLDSKTIDSLQSTIGLDALAFLPELVLCGGIVLLLLLRLFSGLDRWHLGWAALLVTLFAIWPAIGQWLGWFTFAADGPFFGGLLVYDKFMIFVRLLLLGFAALTILLTLLT